MRQRRLFAVSAWRDSPYFTDAERAALALAEAAGTTRRPADPQEWQERESCG